MPGWCLQERHGAQNLAALQHLKLLQDANRAQHIPVVRKQFSLWGTNLHREDQVPDQEENDFSECEAKEDEGETSQGHFIIHIHTFLRGWDLSPERDLGESRTLLSCYCQMQPSACCSHYRCSPSVPFAEGIAMVHVPLACADILLAGALA